MNFVTVSPEIELLAFTDQAVLPATNTCYDLEDLDGGRVARVVLKNKHRAVLRHGFASFKIKNISRAIGRQILRKSHADYLELSQRYVDVREMPIIIPKKIAVDPEQRRVFENAAIDALKHYETLRAAGATKEDARYALPQSIATVITMSGNLQMWWDFFNLRINDKTQHECRITAEMILSKLAELMPLFKNHPKFTG